MTCLRKLAVGRAADSEVTTIARSVALVAPGPGLRFPVGIAAAGSAISLAIVLKLCQVPMNRPNMVG